ncbi:hypothetical protein UAB78_001 [Escherichia phage UAB_Phi78]|uniref:Uncharacterized protein n=1 Tax=Escherichia phage UAB_Phi78 TaxID=979726 RepID=A0A8F5PMN2_9CAUD|nr:hypothetical protein I132_gp01 [Escherichia phage UAB_Phi78]QXM18124.1 hypothetical protein UAB78_001 [Escherichia phage UAB_Phi78]
MGQRETGGRPRASERDTRRTLDSVCGRGLSVPLLLTSFAPLTLRFTHGLVYLRDFLIVYLGTVLVNTLVTSLVASLVSSLVAIYCCLSVTLVIA